MTESSINIIDFTFSISQLVRFYTRIGFKAVHEVSGSGFGDYAHMLVWGGVGTRMDANVEDLLVKWCTRFKPRKWFTGWVISLFKLSNISSNSMKHRLEILPSYKTAIWGGKLLCLVGVIGSKYYSLWCVCDPKLHGHGHGHGDTAIFEK